MRSQIYKRLDRRMRELGLPDVSAYRAYLETHPEEWARLDARCWITVSRFHRDRQVFESLRTEVLPTLAAMVRERHDGALRCWCIGCAAGEEPYTVAILWKLALASRFLGTRLVVLATDVDARMIARARAGQYPSSSLKDLSGALRDQAFEACGDAFRLRPDFRAGVSFVVDDIRRTSVRGAYHVILCRNLAFTYFDEGLQREVEATILDRLLPGGALVLGSTESLPSNGQRLEAWSPRLRIYRRLTARARSPSP